MKTGIHGSGTLDSRQNTKIYSLRGTITEQYYCTQRGRGVRWGEPQEKKKKKNREIDKLAPIYSLSLYDNKKDRTKIGRSKEVVCNCVKNNLKRKETFLDIHYSFASWLSQVSEWVSVCVFVLYLCISASNLNADDEKKWVIIEEVSSLSRSIYITIVCCSLYL